MMVRGDASFLNTLVVKILLLEKVEQRFPQPREGILVYWVET